MDLAAKEISVKKLSGEECQLLETLIRKGKGPARRLLKVRSIGGLFTGYFTPKSNHRGGPWLLGSDITLADKRTAIDLQPARALRAEMLPSSE